MWVIGQHTGGTRTIHFFFFFGGGTAESEFMNKCLWSVLIRMLMFCGLLVAGVGVCARLRDSVTSIGLILVP